MMMMNLGQLNIKREIIEHEPENVKRIMSECIILRCEYMYHTGCFEYIAQSNHFEEIKEGEKPPFYDVVVNDNKITFIKTKW